MVSDASGKLCRWCEHFEQVMDVTREVNHAALETVPPLPVSEGLNDSVAGQVELVAEPDEEEVRLAISQLQSGQYPGEDSITAEVLKLGGDTVVKWLVSPFKSIRETEQVPQDWHSQITIPLHKKGAADVCDNYRGIALLSVPGKVLFRVIQNRPKCGDVLLRVTVWFSSQQRLCRPGVYSPHFDGKGT